MSKAALKLTIVVLWFVLAGAAAISLSPGRTAGAQEGEITPTAGAQEGEITPTAEPCGAPMLLSNTGNVNVRTGPGLEYDVVTTIGESDQRPVVGRAGFAQWWLIELDNGVTGWVANNAVMVQGNIGSVPVVDAPALPDGTTPTPGAAWIPAIDSFCATSESAEATPSVDNDSEWALPANLSRAGASSDPRMVVDSNGVFHIIWQDSVDGFVYIQGNGAEWSEPAVLELPFGTRVYYPDLNETEPTPYFVPTLAADQSGNVHAFWIDDENGLYYSSVAGSEFAAFESWSTRQSLAASALQLDVILDSSGVLHLSYVRPLNSEESPSGVYYRQSTNNGGEWSTAVPIYLSRYFHAVTADQVNINVATTTVNEATYLFVAWDNRPLGEVLAARSIDGGLTWEAPFRVDGREFEDTAEAVNPANITIGVLGNEVMLVWQAGHGGETCAHYFISSSDAGENWTPRETIQRPRGCHRTNQFMVTEDSHLVLLALVEDVVGTKGYLMAWSGEAWSDPQEQSILTSFKNPETFLEVTFQCHQSTLIRPETLFVIGCDGGDGKDIWLTRRDITNIASWFAPPPIWQPPALIGTQPEAISSLNLLADADGLLHAVWTGPNGAEIYYSSHNNLFWSQPGAVLRAVEGNSGQPEATLDYSGHILVTWSGTTSGQIYFSSAETARALAPSDWSPIQVVSEAGLVAQSPQIIVDPSGTIYLIYVVPLNEERGLYMVRSEDGGATWSPTVQLFDGVAAGWSIVDQPRIAVTADGALHVLVNHYQNLGDEGPLAIFYSRSEDRGESWSSPLLMAEQPVLSAEIFGSGLETLQRLWFVEGNSGLDVWHDLSIDSGLSWGTSSSATGFGQREAPMTVTADAAGRLHVIGVVNNVLQHWMLENNRWTIETDASLETDTPGNVYALGATIAPNGDLAVVFAVDGDDTTLYHTGRALALPEILPTPVPEPIQTPEPTPTTAPTETIEASPTAVLTPTPVATVNVSETAAGPNEGDGSMVDMALSFLPAVLLVGVAFFFGLRAVRGQR